MAVLLLVLSMAGFARGVDAFSGQEHTGLSQVALGIALETLSTQLGSGELTAIRTVFLDCPKAGPVQGGSPQCISFGNLTKSVDLVFHAENLVPDPRICLGQKHLAGVPNPLRCSEEVRPCRPELRRRLEAPGVDVDDVTLKFTADRLDQKSRTFLTRLLAVHRNTSHFEACAATAYNRLHQLALEQARERADGRVGWWRLPLATEALALHFLQDSFPPGHFLTPRTSTPDLLARGMHNRLNSKGAEASLEKSESLRMLGETLLANKELQILLEKSFRLDEAAVRRVLETDLPRSVVFYGDGSLGPQSADETVALILVSARSIVDVLAVGLGQDPSSNGWHPAPDAVTNIAFTSWCGKPSSGSERNRYLDPDTARRPGLTVRAGDRSSAEVLAEYKPGGQDQLDRWTGPRLEVAAGLLASTQGGSGRRAEVALVGGFAGENDVALCDDKGQPTAEFFKNRSLHGFTAALNLRLEQWGTTDIQGVTLLAYPWIGRSGVLHVNSYLGVELGAERYYTRTHSANLPTWGARWGMGLGLVFVELGVKQGHAEKPSGQLRDDTSLSLGLRVQPLR